MLDNRSILVTGGTGSFGRRFISTVLQRYKPKRLIVYSRDELKQFEMQQDFPDSKYRCMRYFIGDIRDLPRLQMAMKDVDVVVHAAALKQVPAAEYNPFEAVKTNIIGGQNVIDACLANNVKQVVALSTDKAAAPINLYGATKLCSDKLFIAANNYTGAKDIKFSVVRYGNVMFSRGSVIPHFMKQKASGVFTVTDPRMTRFNITLEQGVDFVLYSLQKMWGGELFVPKIPSYRITDIAKAVCEDCKIDIIGLRPGEKLHEEMITSTDSLSTIEFSSYYVILPSALPKWDLQNFIQTSNGVVGKRLPDGYSYNSENNPKFLTTEELRALITRAELH
jgi:UDP-N-acetylglucosamine 4,6-dehydratase (inverting)